MNTVAKSRVRSSGAKPIPSCQLITVSSKKKENSQIKQFSYSQILIFNNNTEKSGSPQLTYHSYFTSVIPLPIARGQGSLCAEHFQSIVLVQ